MCSKQVYHKHRKSMSRTNEINLSYLERCDFFPDCKQLKLQWSAQTSHWTDWRASAKHRCGTSDILAHWCSVACKMTPFNVCIHNIYLQVVSSCCFCCSCCSVAAISFQLKSKTGKWRRPFRLAIQLILLAILGWLGEGRRLRFPNEIACEENEW